MRRHVPDESLLDLAEGGGSDAERAHARACAACEARVTEARAALDAARRAEVPEPSPEYWETLRRSVGRKIAEEPRRSPRWAWLVPLAASAVVAAVVVRAPGRVPVPATSPAAALPAWSALPSAEDDPSLDVLEGLAAADVDLGRLDEGRGALAFLADLSDEEHQALADTLRGGGEGGES